MTLKHLGLSVVEKDHVQRRQAQCRFDLSGPYTNVKRLKLQIEADIDAACKAEFEEGPSHSLRRKYYWPSLLGLCLEYFPLAEVLKTFGGPYVAFCSIEAMRKKKRFVRWLTIIGFEVREIDPATNRQYRISGCWGHFGGVA